MYIAVTADGEDLESKVGEKFETASYLLIVDLPGLTCKAIKNEVSDGEAMARQIIAHDCEAVLTGKLDPGTFDILAVACVTRYLAMGYEAGEALRLMEAYALPLIRNAEGTDSCDGNH